MSDAVIIKVDKVSKTFKLPHEKNNSIKSAVINFYRRNNSYEKQQALKDISFEVKEGEFFGIVGRNGSGKSTLLKMLAGIYSPTSGDIHVSGKLTPFIELGVGFNPELTGRENVFLNGALLGFNRHEMQEMYEDIVSFAEIEKFMDQKLKNYSSGMQVRLAFSIAIRAQSDILLIDEVLAVGDAAFQQKCYQVFSSLKEAGRTIVLVTHDMSAVLRFCDRAVLVHDGVVKSIGKPKDIADDYLELNYEAQPSGPEDNGLIGVESGSVKIKSFTLDGKSKSTTSVTTGHNAKLALAFDNTGNEPLQFGIQIFNDAGNYCFGTNTRIVGLAPTKAKQGVANLTIDLNLLPGNYSVTAAVMTHDATKVLAYKPNAASFRITKTTELEGFANLEHNWRISNV